MDGSEMITHELVVAVSEDDVRHQLRGMARAFCVSDASFVGEHARKLADKSLAKALLLQCTNLFTPCTCGEGVHASLVCHYSALTALNRTRRPTREPVQGDV
eukprot:4003934-Pleurochrysis_carterae.AAC.1